MDRDEPREFGAPAPFLAQTLGEFLDPGMAALLASGIGLAAMGAAGIWLLDTTGLWTIVSMASLILGIFIGGLVVFWYLSLGVIGVGAAVVILPMRALWAVLKAIARLGRKP